MKLYVKVDGEDVEVGELQVREDWPGEIHVTLDTLEVQRLLPAARLEELNKRIAEVSPLRAVRVTDMSDD